MKCRVIILFGLLVIFTLNNCKPLKKSSETIVYKDINLSNSEKKMKLTLIKGESFNHPTFVVWIEDMDQNYMKTIFITQSYSSGIFGYHMQGDSIWLPKAGASYQPAALPYWTHRKGLIANQFSVPTPDHPYVDAYTGATPTDNFQFVTAANSKKKQYRILLEVNQTWDWDNYWSNDKYPGNDAYKHSAQPSVIYATTINEDDDIFYLNPIGHGDPTGETGKLFTNMTTLSTAKQIFKSLFVTIKK